MGLFCPVFWEKYSTYHPCVIIIKYNSKKLLLTIQRFNYEWKYWTNVYQKKLVLSHYFAPPIIQKRSNFIILSLFNWGVINISPLYEFLTRNGTFPSLGRFSNIQKYLLSLSFQDVKYSSTQYIVPISTIWGIPALCYDLNLGMIFYWNQDFSGSGVVLGATPHTHPQPLPCLKNLGFNKKSFLDFGS